VKRREFIMLLGGAAAAWPSPARAQQGERMRRIGVLMSTAADDPESQLRLVAFVQGLQQAGWTVGQNLQVDTRWASGDTARLRRSTAELLALSPDTILAGGRVATIVQQVQQTSRETPIVFVQGVDPVGTGYVASLARPGGNVTGFTQFEYTLSGKWLQLLKEVVPGLTRAAVLRESGGAGIGQWAVLQAAASSPAVELSPVNVGDPAEIERAVAAFAREPNGGLIVVVSAWATVHRDLIITLAAKYRLPAIYPIDTSSPAAASSPTGPISSTSTAARPATLIASSRVRSRPICPFSSQQNTSWSSISRLRRHSASTCRRRYLSAPTR
jgi:putative ABC transport system substrate-binding protein